MSVLHGVSNLGLKELSIRTNELVSRAAANTLTGKDFSDGTFTITNAGPLGAYVNTPMINPPQSAILGARSINEEPAVVLKRIVGLLEDPALFLD